MEIINEIPVWGQALPEAVSQMEAARAYDAEKCALMADHHIGYSIPIGGIVAYVGVCMAKSNEFDPYKD